MLVLSVYMQIAPQLHFSFLFPFGNFTSPLRAQGLTRDICVPRASTVIPAEWTTDKYLLSEQILEEGGICTL